VNIAFLLPFSLVCAIMAGPLQIGDIAVIARLAWDVYNLGFTVEHSASTLISPTPLPVLHGKS
jgi:hypothetical protein